MDADIIFLIIAIAILLAFSCFFSVSETGLTAMSRARMHKRASEGNKKAKLALKVRGENDRLIGTILVGNNIANIVASMIAGLLFGRLFTDEGLGLFVATVVMTFLVLIFGEVLPKTYAIKNADKVAMKVAPFMNFFIMILSPITKLVQAISNFLLRIFGLGKITDTMHGHDALRGAIDLHHSEGSVVKDDRDMLGSILDLSHVVVEEVMVHRRDMLTVDINLPASEIVQIAIDSNHTRLPIWENEEENIIGVLHTKDVLKLDRDTPKNSDIRELLHEPQFIPNTTTLRDQLENFRTKRAHMAIVVDEYGALMGLVTLEDILEEIVGQIDDEHDKVISGIKRRQDGSYVVRGNLSIRDLNRELDWNLPVEEDANTVAGLIIALAQQIPDVGAKVSYKSTHFKVLGKVRNQITSVRVRKGKKKIPALPPIAEIPNNV
jgi:Mg2+/Co2+ transporter CorB